MTGWSAETYSALTANMIESRIPSSWGKRSTKASMTSDAVSG